MEQNENLHHDDSGKKLRGAKRTLNFFIILSIILALLCGFLIWQVLHEKNVIEIQKTTGEKTEADKTQMLTKLKNMEGEYDQLIAEYEDLDSLFSKEKEKIVTLQDEIKNFKGTTAEYKKKVAELDNRLQDYLKQIEELKAQNKTLTIENIKVKTSLDSTVSKNSELSTENSNLNNKVKAGSVLKAYEILSDGIRLKGAQEIPTKKAKRVQKIRTCFMLSENALTTKGNKTVYLRIAEPDKKILTIGTDDSYLFEYEGKKIAYSLKKEIYYDNKAMDLCFYWDKIKDFKKGAYWVDIYIDNYLLGSSTFDME